MKLAQKQLLELVPPDPVELAKTCDLFESSVSFPDYKRGELFEAVRNGDIRAETIWHDKQAAFTIFYHVNRSCLHVNGCQTLHKTKPINVAFLGCEMLAKQQGCTSIRFATILSGLIAAATDRGFVAECLVMRKSI